ncbi:MAG: YbaB/EbfC family nucleoid-associated protein [Cytophagales bacterium]
MLGKVKDIQAKLQQTKDKVALDTLSAEAGAGMVKVTVNGKRQVLKIDIDSSLLTPNDKDMVADLVTAATNKALADMDAHIAQELQKATEGLIPNMPGLDLKGLMGLK